MMRSIFIGLIVLLTMGILSLSINVSGDHYGALKTIESDIELLYPSGTAIFDKTGTYYIVHGVTYYTAIVYPEEYWGEYPLYMSGSAIPVLTKILNTGPVDVEKHTLMSEAYYINPDGFKRVTLPIHFQEDKPHALEAHKGEIVKADQVMTLPSDLMHNGLFQVKLYHHASDTDDGSLVITKEGCFCPREYLNTLEVYHASY